MDDTPLTVITFLWFQYHNKVDCFKMQKIEEFCDLGVHANLIVPPTWVLKLPPKKVRHSQGGNLF